MTRPLPPDRPGAAEPTRVQRPGGRSPASAAPTRVQGAGRRADPRALPGDLAERWECRGELPAGGEAVLVRVRARDGSEPRAGRVRPAGPTPERVLKLYGTAVQPHRRPVWAAVRGVRNPHLLELIETGQAGGHDYELSPYYPLGTLEDMIGETADEHGETFAAWPAEQVKGAVRQVASALVALHGAGVLHRDVKPANLLLRSRDPLHLVLGDLGICRLVDTDGRYTRPEGSARFLPPEGHLAGRVWDSPARDWWALGVIVLELATGTRLFRGVHEDALVGEIALRGVDVSGVRDPRLRLLCRGLLTRDYRYRWGNRQVAAWLTDGPPPPVHDPPPEPVGLTLAGRTFTDRAALAAAITADPETWRAAGRRFLPIPGADAGEGWRQLVVWLRATRTRGPAPGPGVEWTEEDLAELLDHRLRRQDLSTDVRVLHLVRWLDPQAAPNFRGVPVTAASLREIADRAWTQALSGRRGGDGALVEQLWRENVLSLLAAPTGRGGPAPVGSEAEAGRAALAGLAARWRTAVGRLATRPVDLVAGDLAGRRRSPGAVSWATAMGLWLATDPGASVAVLERVLATEDSRLGEWAPAWWRRLLPRVRLHQPAAGGTAAGARGPGRTRIRVQPAGMDRAAGQELDRHLDRGVTLASAVLHLDAAQAEAAAARDQDTGVRDAARLRRAAWDSAEAARVGGIGAARVRAARRILPWLAGAVALTLLHIVAAGEVAARAAASATAAGPPWDRLSLLVFVLVAGVVLAVHAGRELGLVEELGGDYDRPGTTDAGRLRARSAWLARLGDRLRRLPFARQVQVGLALLVAAAMLLALLVAVPALLQVPELVVLSRGVAARRAVWRRAHDGYRSATLGWQPGRVSVRRRPADAGAGADAAERTARAPRVRRVVPERGEAGG